MVQINELIGSLGKYHVWLCCLIFISKFGVAFHTMAIIFLAPPAQYRCPDTNSSCCENPVFDTSVFTRTIVMEWNLICQNTWLKDLHQTIFQFGVLTVILEVFTGIMASFLPDFWSFTIVRMILGFAVGGVLVIGFVIVMEYVGNLHRDVVSALIHIPFSLGHITLALFGLLITDYMYFQLIISGTTVVLLIYICVLPESPRWLLAMNKNIDLYQLEHKSRREKRGTVIDLFRTPNIRRNILLMSFVWFVCSYCFYGLAYYISHLTGDVFINVLACGCVCLCGCIFAIPMIKFMNRRSITILGNALCSACLFILAFIPEGKGSVVLGCAGIFFSYITFIVGYLYCSEMFPTVVRNAALGISSMMARLGAMVAPFMAGLRPYGQWCAPVGFGVMPMIAACLCLLLPETKGCELMMTIEEGEALGFYILYCPVMYLMFINHQLYRKVVDTLFALWELYPVSTILVMNHRTRVDWNYVWIALYHATQDPNAGNHCICRESLHYDSSAQSNWLDLGGRAKMKFVLKDEIKFGWIMQLNYFLYIKRNWREDETSVSQYVDYYTKLRYKCRLLLFPEGTDLCDSNKLRSWAVLCSQLRRSGLTSVYDVTVAYDTPAQTEADMLKGRIPGKVYFHFKRYSIEQLPKEEVALKTWLNDRAPRSLLLAKVAFIFWTIIDVMFAYALYNSLIFRFWALYHTILFIFVTWFFGGFHNIQYNHLNWIKKIM
ncbi:Organic cation transporter [Operophtera brumata]|uniref:Organic cation transporter n=1 Tax=Operophtera brumata TaxID=104452 RepID=A0A0L7KVQ6_OPEBR|nr:Organic cation transporter [Operophtera brumata]